MCLFAYAAAVLCAVCKPGYGGQSCTACPIGTFSLGGPRGSAQCTPCGAGLTTAANTSTAATACAVCLPGFGGESCTACAKGSWSAGGTEDTAKPACTGCTTGSTTSGTGSTASTACNVCTAGYGGVVSGTCSLCPVGTSRSGEALATVNCTTCAGTTTTLTEGQATCNGKLAHVHHARLADTACCRVLATVMATVAHYDGHSWQRRDSEGTAAAAAGWLGGAQQVQRFMLRMCACCSSKLVVQGCLNKGRWQQFAAAKGARCKPHVTLCMLGT